MANCFYVKHWALGGLMVINDLIVCTMSVNLALIEFKRRLNISDVSYKYPNAYICWRQISCSSSYTWKKSNNSRTDHLLQLLILQFRLLSMILKFHLWLLFFFFQFTIDLWFTGHNFYWKCLKAKNRFKQFDDHSYWKFFYR